MENKKIDFSQAAINAAVKGIILQHPLSLYSISLGGLGLLSFLLLSAGQFIFFVSLGLIGLGLFTLGFNFLFRRDALAGKYLDKLNKMLAKQQQMLLARLIKDLKKFQKNQGLKLFAGQAVDQYDKVKDKFTSFKKMLSNKFNTRELTYGRFIGTTEQLYLSVLDNLENIAHSMETVKNIEPDYIAERLKHLNSLKDPEDADKREIETLHRRTELRKKQLEKINDLLTINEEAMTQIDLSLASISDLKTKEGHATMSMETAREELEDLIRRTKKYSMME